MIRKNKILILAILFALSLLVACNKDAVTNEQKTEPVPEPIVEDEGVALPETKKITLLLEGMEEEKEAQLVQTDSFAFYKFDIFEFDENSGVLRMHYDGDYRVKIEKLSEEADIDELYEAQKAKLAEKGEVTEEESEKGDLFYLIVRSDEMNYKTTAKEIDGAIFLFEQSFPNGEALEGFAGHVGPMLDTLSVLP